MKIEEVFARRRFIMLDGAMGTQLQLRGLTTEQKPELAAFIMPDVLTAVHRDYARAGADILLANTFGANPRKLKGTGYTVQQVIEASIACARTAAQETGALVALDIGPIGELLAPAGTLPFEDACAQFAEMVRAGAAAGADLVFLETMTDLYELKAAILAAKENCDLPVFTSMSFEARGRTFTGCTVESYGVTAAGLGADAVGINCSLGPKEILPFAQRLCRVVPAGMPVFVKPNAGLPNLDGSYDITPAEFAAEMAAYFETGKRALDFLVEHSGTRHNLEVDFFGGEPLMNFEVCKQLVAYARSIEKEKGKNFRFTLTTNGIGITDEVIEWANKECYNVVLSLDGRKEINDRFRKDIAGRGSYDRIVPKFQQLVKARGGKGYYMRGTFTHYNTDFTNDLFHMADDLGFDELSMEPVVSKAGSPEALTEADLPILFDQYELLAKDMLRREKAGHPITFYHYMIDLAHGPCIYKRISGCGSGTEYMAVTPWGDLYPCHQFVGDPDYKLGDIWNGVTNTELRDEFKLCNVYARPDCKDCWARLYCAGGCAANALHATGDIHGVYEYGCEVFRKRIECALMIKVAESLDPELAGRAATAAPATDEDCGDCSSCE